MEALVASLIAWICATTGYDVPALQPAVEFVTHRAIIDKMCDGEECSVVGMYLHGEAVYLDEKLDVENNTYHVSILLHELIHYVQNKSGRFPTRDCGSWVAQEREAYAFQARWLRQRHVWYPMRRHLLSPDFCERLASKGYGANR
jgi:hypothetical protein